MSETGAAGAAAGAEGTEGTGTQGGSGAGTEGGAAQGAGKPPPWGSDENFSPAKAWDALQNARRVEAAAKAERDAAVAKVTEAERAKMDDKARAESERDEWKGKATSLEATSLKLEVALAAAPDTMKPSEVVRLAKRLTGSTKAELEDDAKELFEQFGGTTTTSTGKAPVTGRPQTRLRAGANNDEDDADNSDVDIEKVPRM